MEVWSSQEMLSHAEPGNHFVQLYQDRQNLAEIVCHFISHELAQSCAAIVVARDAHIQDLDQEFTRQGMSMAKLVVNGQLWIYDADVMLARLLKDGQPDGGAFLKSVGTIFTEVFRRHKSARVYGEMVDILWQRGERDSALQLENYWNTLLKDFPFSLLCAYAMDNLDTRNYDGAIQSLCHCHSHLLLSQSSQSLEQAMLDIHAALQQPSPDQDVFSISALGHPTTIMPAAQAQLLSLCQAQPEQLTPLLHALRSHLAEHSLKTAA